MECSKSIQQGFHWPSVRHITVRCEPMYVCVCVSVSVCLACVCFGQISGTTVLPYQRKYLRVSSEKSFRKNKSHWHPHSPSLFFMHFSGVISSKSVPLWARDPQSPRPKGLWIYNRANPGPDLPEWTCVFSSLHTVFWFCLFDHICVSDKNKGKPRSTPLPRGDLMCSELHQQSLFHYILSNSGPQRSI